ncbi:unnamed protein product, partial [Didymodactylos carnosus]
MVLQTLQIEVKAGQYLALGFDYGSPYSVERNEYS